MPSDNDPVRQLIDEHEIFMDALEELASLMASIPEGARELPAGGIASAERIWHAVNEHLNVHFVKEEEVFFPYIERLIPGARVKFQFLHVDHDRLREAFDRFTEAIQDYHHRDGAHRSVATFRTVAVDMIRWFKYHIVAEDSIYFEIAGKTMSPEEAAIVLSDMAAIEARLREHLPQTVGR